MRSGQMTIAEVFFQERVEDWWEPWMKHADRILEDEDLIEPVYRALRGRHRHNVHYPTDSSLLGDGVGVLTRVMKRVSTCG